MLETCILWCLRNFTSHFLIRKSLLHTLFWNLVFKTQFQSIWQFMYGEWIIRNVWLSLLFLLLLFSLYISANMFFQCRKLVEMLRSYFMALRKVMRGRQHIWNVEPLISLNFLEDLRCCCVVKWRFFGWNMTEIYIYISGGLVLESINLWHVTHFLKLSLFRLLLQQKLHLYQNICSSNQTIE